MIPTNEVTTRRPATSHAWDELIRRMDAEMQKVRDKAFRLFQMRNPEEGTDLDDWFKAEKELFAEYPAETKDTGAEMVLTIGVPGFEAKELTVTVLPESIVVEGKTTKTEKDTTETREFLRHFPLPCAIRTEEVKAVLDAGKLMITAKKQAVEPAPVPKPVEVKAASA